MPLSPGTNNKTDPHPGSPSAFALKAAGLSLVFLGGAIMVYFGWRRWSDLMIDIGNQLYIPWQITEGQVLYHDLFYVFGPLSPYLHSLIFNILGPGAFYLSMFNLFLTFCLTVIIYKIFLRLGGTWTATLVGLNFLTVHALGQHKLLGNFNFIQSYSYDLTHGIFLSFLAIHQFLKYTDRPNLPRLFGIGILLGLIFLTKIEVMFAASLSLLPGLVLFHWLRHPSPRALGLMLVIVLSGLALPFLLFAMYFSFHMPVDEALHHLLNPYLLALNQSVHEAAYIKINKGTYNFSESLEYIFTYIVGFLLLIALLVQINHWLNQAGKNKFWYGFSITSVFVGLLLFYFREIHWKFFLLPLPFIMIAFSLYLLFKIKNNFVSSEDTSQNLGILVLTVFSLLLTVKIFFKVVIYHYGFALSLPASLMGIYLVMNWIPKIFEDKLRIQYFYRFAASVLILFYIVALNFDSYRYFSKKVVPVGEGADLQYDFHPKSRTLDGHPYMKGMMVQFALEYIRDHVEPGAEMAVIPDAIMINYLSRHRDPAKGFLLNPFSWVIHAQDGSYLRDLQSSAPPYIILMDRNFPAWDVSIFGRDFGQDIYRWIQEDYHLMHQIGPTPFTEAGFGIQFYKRK